MYNGTHITISPFVSESVYMFKLKNTLDIISIIAGMSSVNDFNWSDMMADPATDPDPTTGNFICLSQDQLRKMLTDPSSVDTSELSLVRITSDTNATINLTRPYTVSKEVKEQTEAVTGYQYPATVQDEWGQGTEIKIAGMSKLKPRKLMIPLVFIMPLAMN